MRFGLPVIAVIGNDACWSQMYRDQVRAPRGVFSSIWLCVRAWEFCCFDRNLVGFMRGVAVGCAVLFPFVECGAPSSITKSLSS